MHISIITLILSGILSYSVLSKQTVVHEQTVQVCIEPQKKCSKCNKLPPTAFCHHIFNHSTAPPGYYRVILLTDAL